MSFRAFLLMLLPLAVQCARKVPCVRGQKSRGPDNCNPRRWKTCGHYYHNLGYSMDHIWNAEHETNCRKIYQYEIGDYLVVQFDGQDGCKEIQLAMGECWGNHPQVDGRWDCMGRCGGGCAAPYDVFFMGGCNQWAVDCLRHDVCGWYYGATGGDNDANCGDEWDMAEDDTLKALTSSRPLCLLACNKKLAFHNTCTL